MRPVQCIAAEMQEGLVFLKDNVQAADLILWKSTNHVLQLTKLPKPDTITLSMLNRRFRNELLPWARLSQGATG